MGEVKKYLSVKIRRGEGRNSGGGGLWRQIICWI